MEQWSFSIVTADIRQPITIINTLRYQDLLKEFAKKFEIPEKILVFFCNDRYIPFIESLNHPSFRPHLSTEILAAVKGPINNPIILNKVGANGLNLPFISPIVVKAPSGEKIKEVFSLHHNILVEDILRSIEQFYQILPCYQQLTHNGRKLHKTDFLADLYIRDGVFVSNASVDLDFSTYFNELNIQRFNDLYGSAFKSITLETLTGKISIDRQKEGILTGHDLKKYIKMAQTIPIQQQTLLHQGTTLSDSDSLSKRKLQEEQFNRSNKITITLMVTPWYIKIKFQSFYYKVPRKHKEFTSTTTVKEIKLKLEKSLKQSSRFFALTGHVIPMFSEFGNEIVLHELVLLNSTVWISRKIFVKIEGQTEQFFYLVQRKTQTIQEMCVDLEKFLCFFEEGYKLILQNNNLKFDTYLLDVASDDIVHFRCSCKRRCVLM